MADDADSGICTDIRCPCGGATQYTADTTGTVYICVDCNEWVATCTFELADGALITQDAE